jgi:RHS repeat-associated protein
MSVAWFDAGDGFVSESVVEQGAPGDVSETWTERGGIVQRPGGAVTARVRLWSETATGWVTFDDTSLVEVTGAMAAAMPLPVMSEAEPVVGVDVGVDAERDAPFTVLTAGDGELVSETLYYQFDGSVVAMRRDGVLYYLLGDQLGSTSVSYRADGAETLRQFYYPWGGLRGSSEPVVPTDVGFTGQRLDTSTGLMFYQARYYDPLIGRFVSPDSLVPDPSDPQDLNRYSYVSNSPVTFTDPSGHCVIAGQQIYAGPCRQTGSSSWDYGYDYGALDDPDTNGCVNCRDDSYYWRDAVGEDPAAGAVARRASTFWHDNKDSIMFVLEAAKDVAVVVAAIAVVDFACVGTAGLGCPIAVGSGIGAVANVLGDEALDCIGGVACACRGASWLAKCSAGPSLVGLVGALVHTPLRMLALPNGRLVYGRLCAVTA